MGECFEGRTTIVQRRRHPVTPSRSIGRGCCEGASSESLGMALGCKRQAMWVYQPMHWAASGSLSTTCLLTGPLWGCGVLRMAQVPPGC